MHRVDPARPVTEASLTGFFHDRVAEEAERLTPPPQEDTCWYLGTMLDRFGRSERLFTQEGGQLTLQPLAELYGEAVEARNEHRRCLLLQQLGDLALFFGALFPERWARRGIGRDYFVGMGGGAYDYLADNAHRGRHVFAELAGTFTRMLELVAGVCERSRPLDDGDILALYRRWLETRDPVTERQLRSLGITLAGSGRTN